MSTFEIITPLERGYYSATLSDRVIVRKSFESFFAAARVIMDDGCQKSDILVMWHAKCDSVALRGRVVIAVGMTVIENEAGGPRFAVYRPMYRDDESRASVPLQRTATSEGAPAGG